MNSRKTTLPDLPICDHLRNLRTAHSNTVLQLNAKETPIMNDSLHRRRLFFSGAVVTICGAVFATLSSAVADPTPTGPGVAPLETIPGPVSEELRRIQRDLGGSATEAFPSLREQRGRLLRMRGAASEPAVQSRQAVEALRDAASQLDTTANRLERLELYTQADALREQAQRLRLDARGTIGGATAPTPTRVLPWEEGVWPSSADPRLAPQPRLPEPRALEPQPLEPRPADPQPLEPVPQQPLEPAPSPE